MLILKEIVGGLWFAFYAYWIVAAFGAKRNVRGPGWRQGIGIRVAVAFALYILLRAAHRSPIGNLYGLDGGPGLDFVGVVLCAAGLAFAVWARLHIGRNWGMPMSIKESPELVTSGPYRLVRHPIYAGILLAILGTILVQGSVWLIPFAVFAIYALYSAKVEERRLMAIFPESYPQYQQQTKLLVPYII